MQVKQAETVSQILAPRIRYIRHHTSSLGGRTADNASALLHIAPIPEHPSHEFFQGLAGIRHGAASRY